MEDTAVLWKRYKEEGDLQSRDALVAAYASLVHYVASRLAMGLPPQIELADLESYGLFGLLEAVQRYDPGRGVKFETYAVTRIRGAIIDQLRVDTWAPALRQKARQLDEAQATLQSELGREPTGEELAARLGLSPPDLLRRQAEVSAALLLSLDEPAGAGEEREAQSVGDRLVDLRSPDPEAAALHAERREILARAIERLTDRERLVISLLYYEGLSTKEIAGVLGLSVPRISQLHSKAILKLRSRLGRLEAQLTS